LKTLFKKYNTIVVLSSHYYHNMLILRLNISYLMLKSGVGIVKHASSTPLQTIQSGGEVEVELVDFE